jgi:23S rRNA maturation-related 3'-5' exoribonuclease YhaM
LTEEQIEQEAEIWMQTDFLQGVLSMMDEMDEMVRQTYPDWPHWYEQKKED